MLKQGVIQLVENFFPKFEERWAKEEQDRMIIVTGLDNGEGLSIIQSVPELAKEDKCIAYTERYRAGVDIYYPRIKTAVSDEYIHTKIICLLNGASADQENVSYKMTFFLICDKDNKNFELVDIFTGDTEQGNWATKAQITGMAECLSLPAYKANDQKDN